MQSNKINTNLICIKISELSTSKDTRVPVRIAQTEQRKGVIYINTNTFHIYTNN
jgi:hypothetical protein